LCAETGLYKAQLQVKPCHAHHISTYSRGYIKSNGYDLRKLLPVLVASKTIQEWRVHKSVEFDSHYPHPMDMQEYLQNNKCPNCGNDFIKNMQIHSNEHHPYVLRHSCGFEILEEDYRKIMNSHE